MKEINCSSWEEFETKISAIFNEQKEASRSTAIYLSNPLFRGQKSAVWKLETTLERFGKQHFAMADYYHIIRSVIPAVTSLTEKPWVLAEYSEDEAKLKPPPGYEFMVYLRHHGFPSPLLDWTRSPYVAAFFAFRSKPITTDEGVAIYSYIEYSGGGKIFSRGKASLVGLGPDILTHKRHHTQQCEYTICKKHVDQNYVYCPHEEAFSRNTEDQDQLTKFILPQSERTKVLEKLNFMNVNAYSLFGNEEGLMETLAYQEIEKRFP